MLLVAFKDHHIRIEVGYGLEGAITDAYSNRIINTIMTPEFKQGHFSEGIEKGTAAIVSLIAKEYNITLSGVPEPVYENQTSNSLKNLFWIIFIVLFFCFRSGWFFLPLGYGSSSYGGGGGGFGGGFGGFGGGGSGGGGASGGW